MSQCMTVSMLPQRIEWTRARTFTSIDCLSAAMRLHHLLPERCTVNEMNDSFGHYASRLLCCLCFCYEQVRSPSLSLHLSLCIASLAIHPFGHYASRLLCCLCFCYEQWC